MQTTSKYLIVLLLFIYVVAEAVELNLPERFDAKVLKWWVTENGVKIAQGNGRELSNHGIIHFKKNRFWFSSKSKHYNNNGEMDAITVEMANGTFKDGVLEGKQKGYAEYYTNHFSNANDLIQKVTILYRLSGYTNSNGVLHIVQRTQEQSAVMRKVVSSYETGVPDHLGKWISNPVWDNSKIDHSHVVHYLLQLPINQFQSQQKFIDDPKLEIQESIPQATTIPKVTLSTNAGVSVNTHTQETVPKTISNPCKDPNQDTAMKEYCTNKAHNTKLDQEEAVEDKAKEKAWGEEDKQEETQQKMLDEWYEEDRQTNIKHIKELDEQKRRSQEAEQRENKTFHDKLAKEMQKRKEKQAKKAKAQRKIYESKMIIHQSVDDAEQRKLYLDKINTLSNKDSSLEDATKIKNATRKFYDAKQLEHQAEAVYQTAKAKEIDKKGKYVKSIKDTSLTANRILAEIDKTGLGKKIFDIQKDIYTYLEGGIDAVAFSRVKGEVDSKTFKLGGGLVDRNAKILKYHTTGLKVTPKDRLYNKNGYLLRKVKKGDRVFNKNKRDITFSFERHLHQYSTRDLTTHKARKDILSGDAIKSQVGLWIVGIFSKALVGKLWRK